MKKIHRLLIIGNLLFVFLISLSNIMLTFFGFNVFEMTTLSFFTNWISLLTLFASLYFMFIVLRKKQEQPDLEKISIFCQLLYSITILFVLYKCGYEYDRVVKYNLTDSYIFKVIYYLKVLLIPICCYLLYLSVELVHPKKKVKQ